MQRLYWDTVYPSDPGEAENEAFQYWAAAGGWTWEQAAFAAIVARRVAEIARDGLIGKRK